MFPQTAFTFTLPAPLSLSQASQARRLFSMNPMDPNMITQQQQPPMMFPFLVPNPTAPGTFFVQQPAAFPTAFAPMGFNPYNLALAMGLNPFAAIQPPAQQMLVALPPQETLSDSHNQKDASGEAQVRPELRRGRDAEISPCPSRSCSRLHDPDP